ncbi:helix-turn-helix domain-containing protein [Streptomyces anulatus]|nr:helix-turn-helix domain-containing protein [Streptomyces anulatus]WSU72660.1 helix-turn-helix domain-containing protein [Streptomyces anulatus]
MGRPITDTDRRAVRRHHAAGLSRNDIARKIKRSASTVPKPAAEMGLSFNRGRRGSHRNRRTESGP